MKADAQLSSHCALDIRVTKPLRIQLVDSEGKDISLKALPGLLEETGGGPMGPGMLQALPGPAAPHSIARLT